MNADPTPIAADMPPVFQTTPAYLRQSAGTYRRSSALSKQ
jgi:hypothetical protein